MIGIGFECVEELGVFGSAMRVDDVPERLGQRRWCLRIEIRKVELSEIGRDVAVAAIGDPAP